MAGGSNPLAPNGEGDDQKLDLLNPEILFASIIAQCRTLSLTSAVVIGLKQAGLTFMAVSRIQIVAMRVSLRQCGVSAVTVQTTKISDYMH